jgi:hypothetical protein
MIVGALHNWQSAFITVPPCGVQADQVVAIATNRVLISMTEKFYSRHILFDAQSDQLFHG